MKYYGMAKEHNQKSKEIYDFISKLDLEHGDMFCFKSGGDGDNGECLMDLLDIYFLDKRLNETLEDNYKENIANMTELEFDKDSAYRIEKVVQQYPMALIDCANVLEFVAPLCTLFTTEGFIKKTKIFFEEFYDC